VLQSILHLLCEGLDYVGHEDVLPYKTTQKQPIFNHLFDKFLVASDTTAGTIATAFVQLHNYIHCLCCLVSYTARHPLEMGQRCHLDELGWLYRELLTS